MICMHENLTCPVPCTWRMRGRSGNKTEHAKPLTASTGTAWECMYTTSSSRSLPLTRRQHSAKYREPVSMRIFSCVKSSSAVEGSSSVPMVATCHGLVSKGNSRYTEVDPPSVVSSVWEGFGILRLENRSRIGNRFPRQGDEVTRFHS